MIHFVVGTKAQLIKIAPIMAELKRRNVEYRYISTGQHRDTMAEIQANFEIKGPDISVYDGPDIVRIPQMLGWMLRILWATFRRPKEIFGGDKGGIVLVHGDTFSTILGALMGRVAGLHVAHVESGLRSFNWLQPFPEELTRLATFALSDHYFCPNEWALNNLRRYRGVKINTEANTLMDSLYRAIEVTKIAPSEHVPSGTYGIVTLHRFENFKDLESVRRVVECVELIARKHRLLFILHKPTEYNLRKHGLYDQLAKNPSIELRPRYSYFPFVQLLLKADFVVSDGGSNQEECFYLGKPTLLLRNVTERQEGLGINTVISAFDPAKIEKFLIEIENYRRPLRAQETFPSKVIADQVLEFR